MKNCYAISASKYLDYERAESLKLLDIYNSVCNLVTPDNNLFSIGKRTVGNGPFSIIISDKAFNELKKNLNIRLKIYKHNNQIIFGEKLKIIIRNKKIWDPLIDVHFTESAEFLLIELLNYFKLKSSGKGVSNILLLIDKEKVVDNSLNLKICEIILENFQAMLYNYKNNRGYKSNIEKIIGLGTGLTPSGDDFIRGAITGFFYFYDYDKFESLTQEIYTISEQKTNIISRNYIKSAIHGLIDEKMKNFLHSLTEKNEIVFLNLKSVIETGETSGIDYLTGFFASYITGYEILEEWRLKK
ncbi:MAG TPA: DUF2877 domain-containing protein [Candidatus Atribacteria bacterium]|nr:DUF2877 domain-containing protein [Candidatus Atribacteria bacterium]